MSKPLGVDDSALTATAASCAQLAATLAADGPPPLSGAPYQPSTAAITALLTDAHQAQAALAARVRDTAAQVSTGGTVYANTDADSATKLGGQMT